MSQSSGILLASLGENLMKFADVQHSTKISSLEAEAQSRKELRLQEMQLSQNDITNAFRVADYESSQERLGIAQESAQLAKEKFDYEKEKDLDPDYVWKASNVYGTVTVKTTDDSGLPVTKEENGIIGQEFIGFNKNDPDDIRKVGMDGTVTKISGADLTAANASAQAVSGTAMPVSFDSMSDLEDHIVKHNKAAGEPVTSEEAKSMAKEAVDSGRVTISGSAAETPTAGAETDSLNLAPDAGGTYPEFPQHSVFQGSQSPLAKRFSASTPRSRSPDAANSTPNNAVFDPNQQWENPSDPLGPESFVPKPNPAQTMVLSEVQGRPDRFPNVGTAVEEPSDAAGLPIVVKAEGDVFAYDEAKSEAFIEGLIKDMQAVNISQEDIRKELLSLLGEIPKEQANGEFAKALATAYYEFTKGSN
jgi:hypothetical protein